MGVLVEGPVNSRLHLLGDIRGVPITASSSAAIDAMEELTLALVGHRRDTAALLERALSLDPGLVPALCVKGFACRFLGRNDLIPAARAIQRVAAQSLADR